MHELLRKVGIAECIAISALKASVSARRNSHRSKLPCSAASYTPVSSDLNWCNMPFRQTSKTLRSDSAVQTSSLGKWSRMESSLNSSSLRTAGTLPERTTSELAGCWSRQVRTTTGAIAATRLCYQTETASQDGLVEAEHLSYRPTGLAVQVFP